MKQNGLISKAACFLPHLLFTFGIMLLTFYCITLVNEAMGFLSSFFSQKFEVLYVITAILTASAAFAKKRVPILASMQIICAVVMFVPVIISIAKHSMDLLDTKWFRRISLGNALIAVILSIVMIVIQRKAAFRVWKAEQESVRLLSPD